MGRTIKNLPAWLLIYTNPSSLVIEINGSAQDKWVVRIGKRNRPVLLGDSLVGYMYYRSRALPSKSVALSHLDELLPAIQKQGEDFFESSDDSATRIMLQGCDKLSKSLVVGILTSPDLREDDQSCTVDVKGKPQAI